MIVVGMLSGTSVDAIDVAVAEFTFSASGELTLRPLGHREHPWPAGLDGRILAALPPAITTVAELCALDNEIGKAFGTVASAAIGELAGGRADLVASLGQTVYHDVAGSACRGTLQLGQPAWIAEATGLPVVSDLRATDVAAGGHGAPLASTLDALWLAGPPDEPRAALNLGGIANITVVTGRQVVAFDTGPGNCLLDLAARRVTGQDCDRGGAIAARGRIRDDLLSWLRTDPYFALPPPKSTGLGLFGAGYLDAALDRVPAVGDADLLATLTELTALTVAGALARYRPVEVVVSGGGARNPSLLAAVHRRLPGATWLTSDQRGLPADGKEAYLVALLGVLSWHGLPGTVAGPDGRTVTGAGRPTALGRITAPQRSATVPPSRLRLLPS